MKLSNKTQKETKFFTVYYNKKDRTIPQTIYKIKEAYNKNKAFFKKEIKKFKVILVYSRREYNEYHSSKKTKKYHIASARKNQRLLLLSPDKIKVHSTHSKKDFPWILNHELNHLFYYNSYKTNKPWWLNEGFALLNSNYHPEKNLNLIKELKEKSFPLIYKQDKNNREFIFKNSKYLYPLAYLTTKYLKENYRVSKINKLLKEFSKHPAQKNFNKKFKETFKKTQNQIIKEVIKNMTDCIFCKIVNQEIPYHKIWEDEKHLAFLSIFPNTEGFSVVIPKKHYPSYAFDLPDKILSDLILASKKVAKLIDSKLEDVGRTGMIFEGFGIDHIHAKLFPMHGTENLKNWKPLKSNIDKYFKKYEGYISSHDYKREDDAKLARLARKIRGD